jgi:hypothetical protein
MVSRVQNFIQNFLRYVTVDTLENIMFDTLENP